jgi:hypothetical protein
VSGVLEYVGGPATANQPLTQGWVRFDGPISTRIAVDRHGRFDVALPPGTYRVTGGPENGHFCAWVSRIVVEAGQSKQVSLQCHIY